MFLTLYKIIFTLQLRWFWKTETQKTFKSNYRKNSTPYLAFKNFPAPGNMDIFEGVSEW